ncbi:iron complex transport system substrate-binding protein [Tenacibaculum sp. MAR_2009_124]|uniref:ABC transporter substrate-binding protein n=1 Tax=Tenacibaculum sp. MAR_2009_124 TaxID=1250059 RepID=UPI000895CFEF|nr:ABC transporter substrate-binding protein [Tenacibaculum sp. MAR_2009_124]SEB54913.1 iron complex transport system substrate-binding protein [Tenacibaculum sp. MAR_2009_124]
MKNHLLLFVLAFSLFQCKEKSKNNTQTTLSSSKIKYAKGFDIINKNGEKRLIIKKVFQNSDQQFTYILADKSDITQNKIKVPVETVVATSTTHIPMLESLNVETSLIGFPHTKYISSGKTRNRIKNGNVIDLGLEQDMNTEKLLDLQPQIVIGFSLHPNSKLYNTIKKTGIPIVFNGDWLEKTPLGRAEWIKFFGALYNKEKEADSIFSRIESEYLRVKSLVRNIKNTPTVISGSMFKDVWNVPAGESYFANFLKDSNLNYTWKESKGTGSLQLNFENVLEKGKNANYWLNCGLYETKDQLSASNPHFKEFKSFNDNNVYTIAHKKGETGGLLYFELSPMRPDLVLKDFIKITNPSLLPNYNLTFFGKLK